LSSINNIEHRISTILVDDEHSALNSLRILIEKTCPELEIVGTASSVNEAYKLISSLNPSVIFLDIEMSDGSGFDLLEKLGGFNFKVIFTTAYEHYALKALKKSALDYLLKPIDDIELREAVNKLNEEIQEIDDIPIQAINTQAFGGGNRLLLPKKDCYRVIKLEDLIRCESDNNYTNFYLKDGEKIMISKTLKDFELPLLQHDFLRIHQSHLVNINFIAYYYAGRGGNISLVDGTILPVSRNKKSELLNALDLTRNIS